MPVLPALLPILLTVIGLGFRARLSTLMLLAASGFVALAVLPLVLALAGVAYSPRDAEFQRSVLLLFYAVNAAACAVLALFHALTETRSPGLLPRLARVLFVILTAALTLLSPVFLNFYLTYTQALAGGTAGYAHALDQLSLAQRSLSLAARLLLVALVLHWLTTLLPRRRK